jgi:hypothetical protein
MASLPPPPMQQSAFNPTLPPPPVSHARHPDSVSSQDPITSTGVMEREPSPNPAMASYYGNAVGYGEGRTSGFGQDYARGYLHASQGYGEQGQGQWHPNQAGFEQGPRAQGGWVDERLYNGPYYGREEAFGR